MHDDLQMSHSRATSLVLFGLALALLVHAPAHASPAQTSAVDNALSTHCPDAQSEEVIDCAQQITVEADKRIRRNLCAYRPNSCAMAFKDFVARRDELTMALVSAINERSVVAQIAVALFALQTTFAFEEAGAFKERHDLEKQLAR